MSMSVAAELELIAQAQEGTYAAVLLADEQACTDFEEDTRADLEQGARDGEVATLALLAEYRPNIERIVYSNPGYDADDLRSELTAGLLDTLAGFDSDKSERLWPSFAASGMLDALKTASDMLYPVTVPTRTAQRARSVTRRVENGEAIEEALASEHMAQDAYVAVTAAFGYADVALHDDSPEHEYDESRSTELAEVALDGMSYRRRALARIKYGFDVPIPTDSNSNGLPDIEVAHHYSAQVIGIPRALTGELALSRRSITREVEAGLVEGEVAVRKYLASEGE